MIILHIMNYILLVVQKNYCIFPLGRIPILQFYKGYSYKLRMTLTWCLMLPQSCHQVYFVNEINDISISVIEKFISSALLKREYLLIICRKYIMDLTFFIHIITAILA